VLLPVASAIPGNQTYPELELPRLPVLAAVTDPNQLAAGFATELAPIRALWRQTGLAFVARLR